MEEKREFQITSETSRPNGRSTYECQCPFCKGILEIQKWSFRTTGKRCSCGAVLRANKATKLIK